MQTVIRLTYRGNGAFRPGLPAHDIDRAELVAIAAARKCDVELVVDEAVGSGLYVATLEDVAPDVAEADTAAHSGEGDQEPAAADVVEPEPDPIDNPRTVRKVLVDIATAEGLTVDDASETKASIVARIRAERQRLAEADTAAHSGEGDQGGTVAGDDPDAESPGEPAAPPADPEA